MIIRLSAD